MILKYKSLLESRPDQPCPCAKAFGQRETVGFRFLKADPAEENDFVPPAVLAPRGRDTCAAYALSFFDSFENAQKKFKKLATRVDATSKYGRFIGRVRLSAADGLSSLPTKDGHIDLHPEQNVRFADRVDEIKTILD